ncbi:ABC transporter permease subunit [Candidatus Poribacteria bacterium]|nr:ABC transporter permease subunit [Candidatus Poribacteria bacterium]
MIIKTIAVNTFKEAIRDKVLYSLLAFTVIVIVLSVVIGRLTIGEDQRIIKDIGLAAMSLFGVLIATFVGTNLVHKEINRKTIYTIISKPIRRFEFVLGKYFGLLMTIFINLIVMTVVLFAVLMIHKVLIARYIHGFSGVGYFPLLKAIGLVILELMLITSVAILFSIISTPTLSVFFTLGVYAIGHISIELKAIGDASGSAFIYYLCSVFYYLLPNLNNFNIRAEMVRDIYVSNSFIFYSVVYGVLYMSVILIVTILSFDKKEFV